MAYEYSDLEIKAILGAEDITYNPNFLLFITKKIRDDYMLERIPEIIAYLKRLANIKAFYPQALKVLEEIVSKDPQQVQTYFEFLERIYCKYPEQKIRESLKKRGLNFIRTLAPKRNFQKEIIIRLNICKRLELSWQIEALETLSEFFPRDAVSMREPFREKIIELIPQCHSSEELDILSEIARRIHVYISELEKYKQR